MIKLIPMTEGDYPIYLRNAIESYALEKSAAGYWPEEGALESSRDEFAALLPLGIRTPGHSLFSIVLDPEDQKVGVIWLARKRSYPGDQFFIYDFLIFEEFRRKGYGEGALRAAEEFALSQGIHELGLHVFGRNAAARALYNRLGYVETSVNMRKKLA